MVAFADIPFSSTSHSIEPKATTSTLTFEMCSDRIITANDGSLRD